MGKRFDPLRVLESAYSAEESDEAWLAGVAEAFAPLASQGVIATRARFERWRLSNVVDVALGADPALLERSRAMWSAAPPELVRAWFRPVPPVDTLAARLRRLQAAGGEGPPIPLSRTTGVRDALGIMGMDPSGHALFLSIPSALPIRLAPRLSHRLGLVSHHLAAAARLRALAAPDGGVEAVLDPSGKVQHAEGPAKDGAARRSLALAVSRAERARGRLRGSDPDAALELWRGLVDGRWSLVDHVESDGRRVVLVRRNPPGVRDPKALTPRERDVLGHVVQGHGNKHVAYALGLSTTTVASHLRTALAKLGLGSRRDAIAIFGGGRPG